MEVKILQGRAKMIFCRIEHACENSLRTNCTDRRQEEQNAPEMTSQSHLFRYPVPLPELHSRRDENLIFKVSGLQKWHGKSMRKPTSKKHGFRPHKCGPQGFQGTCKGHQKSTQRSQSNTKRVFLSLGFSCAPREATGSPGS